MNMYRNIARNFALCEAEACLRSHNAKFRAYNPIVENILLVMHMRWIWKCTFLCNEVICNNQGKLILLIYSGFYM